MISLRTLLDDMSLVFAFIYYSGTLEMYNDVNLNLCELKLNSTPCKIQSNKSILHLSA